MDYLYYAFYFFASSIPFVKGKENIETAAMSNLGLGLVINSLTVLEVFMFCINIDSKEVLLWAYLAVCTFNVIIVGVYYSDDKVQDILHRYKGKKYARNLVLYVLISFSLLLVSLNL